MLTLVNPTAMFRGLKMQICNSIREEAIRVSPSWRASRGSQRRIRVRSRKVYLSLWSLQMQLKACKCWTKLYPIRKRKMTSEILTTLRVNFQRISKKICKFTVRSFHLNPANFQGCSCHATTFIFSYLYILPKFGCTISSQYKSQSEGHPSFNCDNTVHE